MKTKALIPLIFLFHNVFAQKGNTTMNFLIGHNFSELKRYEDNYPEFKNLTMFGFDFLHRWSFKNKNFIESGIRVQNIGNLVKYVTPNGFISYRTGVTTFSIPITFNYCLNTNKFRIFIFSGATIGYMSEAVFNNNDTFYTTESKFLSGVKFGLTGGIKIVPKLNKERIGIIINYTNGLNPFLETRTFNKTNGLINYDINRGTNLSVGLSYFY